MRKKSRPGQIGKKFLRQHTDNFLSDYIKAEIMELSLLFDLFNSWKLE